MHKGDREWQEEAAKEWREWMQSQLSEGHKPGTGFVSVVKREMNEEKEGCA